MNRKYKNKEERDAVRKLRRNFFHEAMIRELDLEYKKQLAESIKRGIARKRLFTPKVDM